MEAGQVSILTIGGTMFKKEVIRECAAMDLVLRELRYKMKLGKLALRFIQEQEQYTEFMQYMDRVTAKKVPKNS